jgi:hypothetical protein
VTLDAAEKLGLDWGARSIVSYTFLFDAVKTALNLSMRDLTYENFKGVEVTPKALGLRPAD